MFGYRFITDELHLRGLKVSENRMHRLCREHRVWLVFAKKRELSRRGGPPVHDDLIDRQFTSEAANWVCLTDITEHTTSEEKLYLCAVKDVWSRRIVGYSISDRMTSDLAVNAAMESFFSLLQKNVLNRQRWATRDELRIAIIYWVESNPQEICKSAGSHKEQEVRCKK